MYNNFDLNLEKGNLYRFEISKDGDSLGVGIINGIVDELPDHSISAHEESQLLLPFDEHLAVPPIECFDSNGLIISFFTYAGAERFENEICKIIDAICSHNGYGVIEYICNQNTVLKGDIVYQDANQIILQTECRCCYEHTYQAKCF